MYFRDKSQHIDLPVYHSTSLHKIMRFV